MGFTVRPGVETDIPAINKLHNYYIDNTVITFTIERKTDEEAAQSLETANDSGLPYIVAVDDSSGSIIGFTYVSPFRAKGGYCHTAELSLFVDSSLQGKGVGSVLLKKIIQVLGHPEQFPEYFTVEPRRTRVLMACMAFDINGKEKENGIRLRAFYEKNGFEFSAHLKNVGYKFDRWIDTMYLQLDISDFSLQDLRKRY